MSIELTARKNRLRPQHAQNQTRRQTCGTARIWCLGTHFVLTLHNALDVLDIDVARGNDFVGWGDFDGEEGSGFGELGRVERYSGGGVWVGGDIGGREGVGVG